MKKHIFFDLDHTLWDFDRNAEETLQELYLHHKLQEKGLNSATEFIERYTENNHQLWAQYHNGKITKDFLRAQRFNKTFLELGISPEVIPQQFEDDYVSLSPTKTHLFEGTKEVLGYLKEKYTLHIISNGFKETTLMKIEKCDLNPFFDQIIISEDVGINKPDPAIFKHAITVANANIEESIMIGDSLEADIYGALGFGMDAIFFNPLKKEKPVDVKNQIHELKELLSVF